MTDANTNATFTRVYRGIDIQSQVGAATALIGFTGGTGALNQTQTVTNFHYTPGAALSTLAAVCRWAGVSTTSARAPELDRIHSTCSADEVS